MPGPCAIIIAYGPRASQRCGPRWAFYGRYARYIPPGRKNRKVFAEHDCSYLRLCSIFYLFRGATKMVLWAIVAHSVRSYVCNCVHFYCVPQIELVCTRLPPNLHQFAACLVCCEGNNLQFQPTKAGTVFISVHFAFAPLSRGDSQKPPAQTG